MIYGGVRPNLNFITLYLQSKQIITDRLKWLVAEPEHTHVFGIWKWNRCDQQILRGGADRKTTLTKFLAVTALTTFNN